MYGFGECKKNDSSRVNNNRCRLDNAHRTVSRSCRFYPFFNFSPIKMLTD